MSYSEDLQIENPLVEPLASPVTKSPETVTPKKRTWREIVSAYRVAGYPNAKRFRKQTRLQEATMTIARYKNALQYAAALQGEANQILAKIAKEENWAVRDVENGGVEIEWVADDNVIEAAQKFLKRFTPPTASISAPQQP